MDLITALLHRLTGQKVNGRLIIAALPIADFAAGSANAAINAI